MKISAVIATTLLTACVDGEEPNVSEVSLAASQVFYEKFDPLESTYLDGQNGWTSTGCVVVDGVLPNKFLRCVNGASAWKSTQEFGGPGTYQMQFDYRPNVNVVNSTHGKLSLEGPSGRVFQVIGGCDNIRVAFQMNGPVAMLRTFPCGSTSPDTWYRVVCRWSTGGTTLSCGASVLPADPAPGDYVYLALPSGLRPFTTVQVSTFQDLRGASLWDKIHMVRL
jgi:hypothetical protein